ncbi:hypothetical protein N9D82_02445 [Gammaproteobacteria bacterium]|nr:hypothetical protein [Gammaproteobacteria bacterium]
MKMKIKLLTICLLLVTSQVFAEEIVMKCLQGNGSSTFYKYKSESEGTKLIFGNKKRDKETIEVRFEGRWFNFCYPRKELIYNNRCDYTEKELPRGDFSGGCSYKFQPNHQGYGETRVVGDCQRRKDKEIIVDFITMQEIIKYKNLDKIVNACEKINYKK